MRFMLTLSSELSKFCASGFDPEDASSNRDLISQLPDEILCSFLERLTLRDAARTSVLSHRWRKVWSLLPILRLDSTNMLEGDAHKNLLRKVGPFLHMVQLNLKNMLAIDTRETRCLNAICKDTFVRKVNQFLDSYDHHQRCGSLKLWFCLGKKHADVIDRWVNIALRKMDVHTLSLSLFCSQACGVRRRKALKHENDDKPALCGDNFKDIAAVSLKKLYLFGFILAPNFCASGFLRSLECLALSFVPLTSSYNLQRILSALQSLTVLDLRYCRLPVELHLESLSLLRVLTLRQCLRVEKVVVPNNQNLRRFECICDQLISYDLSGHRKITHLHQCVDDGIQCRFSFLPFDHPKLKSLLIASKVDWVTMIPIKTTKFHGVNLLELWFCRRTQIDMLKLVLLLKVFPILRKFELSIEGFGEYDPESLKHIDYVPMYLQEVKMSGSMNEAHIDFAEFLLRNAKSLRHLVLEKAEVGSSNYVVRQKRWDEEQCQKVCDRLHGLSHAFVELR